MILKFSDEFLRNLEQFLHVKKSLARTFSILKEDVKKRGISPMLYQQYDVKKIGGTHIRVKFPPYRIILRYTNDVIWFENIFKRKGNSDYKKYTK